MLRFPLSTMLVLVLTSMQPAGAADAQLPAGKVVPQRPNVIVIFTDDQGFADLSCQGSVDDIRTPNIDRLALEGVRITDGYITAPQCVPSRAGLMSGRYQQRFGVDANGMGPLPLGVRTLPERLAQCGYATGMVGKWHLEPNPTDTAWIQVNLPGARRVGRRHRVVIPAAKRAPYLPGARGFADYFFGHFSDYLANYNLQGQSLPAQGEVVRTRLYRLDAQSKAAVTFIRRHKHEPFFLYVAYFAPHVPLEAPPRYLRRFPGPMPERRRHALAMMAAIDDGVGEILDELRQYDIDRKTLIFFISDNGAPLKITKEDIPISFRGGAWDGSLNDPWIGEKGMLTEGGIRVPFLMRWRSVLPPGRTFRQPVISLDVAATALAVADSQDQSDLDGVNLLPFLTGTGRGTPHENLYWRFWHQAAVRSGQWKYLYLANGARFLFDLSSAAHERKNLIGRHPDLADRLHGRLSRWAADLKSPGLPSGKLKRQEDQWYRYYLGWSP